MSNSPQLLHVDLELEVGSDPIRGRLGVDRQSGRQFQGWIELAAVLEALLSAPFVAGAPEHYASGDGS